MSTQERDPLDTVINGEWATEESLEFLDTLALELLESQYGVIRRQYAYTSDISDLEPTLTLTTQIDEEDPLSGPAIFVELSDSADASSKFALAFSCRNELIDIHIDETDEEDENPLLTAFILADTLLDDEYALDEPGRSIANHLKAVIEQLRGVKLPAGIGSMPNNGHVADTVRAVIHARTSSAVKTTEYEMPLTDDHTIRVIGQQVLGAMYKETYQEDMDALQIFYDDRKADQEWYYSKSIDGGRMLQVGVLSVEEDYDEELEDEALEELLEELLPTTPTEHDVRMLINELLEVQVIESLRADETRG